MAAVEITGQWQLKIGDEYIEILPPESLIVSEEKYRNLPLYNRNGYGWSEGVALKAVEACGCASFEALCPNTVQVRSLSGKILSPATDYFLEPSWGRIGRREGGAIGEDASVRISYMWRPMRIDSIFQNSNGEFRYVKGENRAWCPPIPEGLPGEIRIVNIYTDCKTDRLRDENIFPVIEAELPSFIDPKMPGRISKTLAKLRNGEKVRILAWGDSVTECVYMPKRNQWQQILVRKLAKAFPEAEIELISNGWGGRATSTFFEVPSGDIHNFQETVADVRADLVISEFINDCGLPENVWKETYPKVLEAFRKNGSEWIIITPHFSRPDWMGVASQKGKNLEKDPRGFVKFLRKFAADNDIALADAAKLYGHLQYCGIPYNTLMTNTINHPDRRGMEIFVKALLPCFGL